MSFTPYALSRSVSCIFPQCPILGLYTIVVVLFGIDAVYGMSPIT